MSSRINIVICEGPTSKKQRRSLFSRKPSQAREGFYRFLGELLFFLSYFPNKQKTVFFYNMYHNEILFILFPYQSMKINMQQPKKKQFLRRHKGLRPVSLKLQASNINLDFLNMMATAMFTNIPIFGKTPRRPAPNEYRLFVYICTNTMTIQLQLVVESECCCIYFFKFSAATEHLELAIYFSK